MRLFLLFLLFNYSLGLSIVGFQQSTPVYYLNGNLYPAAKTQYTLTIACRNGETAQLEGSTALNIPEGVFVDCGGVSRSVIKTLVGYTPLSASIFVADSYQSILIAESRSSEALYHTALAYNANRQFSDGVATSRRRSTKERAHYYQGSEDYYYPGEGVYNSNTRTSYDLENAQAFEDFLNSGSGSGLSGFTALVPPIFIMDQERTTNQVLEAVLQSGLPSADTNIANLISATESNTGVDLSSCNTFFSSGVGISGLSGCIYETINTLDSYANELKLDENAITATEGQIQALAALIQTAQTSVSAVVVSVTQVSQNLQNTLKTVSAGAYIQQIASLTSAGITAAIQNADATQNQNNQNIQTIIQQNQQTNTLAQQTLQNSITSLQQQDQNQLNLVAKDYIQMLAATYSQVQQNIELQDEQQALKTASAYNEFTEVINSLLTTNSYTSQVIAAMNSKFADAYQAVVNLAISATTVDTLCIDTYSTLNAAIDRQGLVPFISDWGTPPANTNTTTLWGTRVFNLDYPQILNTETGQYRQCQTPFGVGQPWKAALNELIAETVPITVTIPTTLDLNLPIYSDYVYLQLFVNGEWQYITTSNYAVSNKRAPRAQPTEIIPATLNPAPYCDSSNTCYSGGSLYTVSMTFCGSGGSEGSSSSQAYVNGVGGQCILTTNSSTCGDGQINYFSIQIHCPFVVIECNAQQYIGALTTSTASIISNPSCSSAYIVNDPVNITFTSGPSGGYATVNLINLINPASSVALPTGTPTPGPVAILNQPPFCNATQQCYSGGAYYVASMTFCGGGNEGQPTTPAYIDTTNSAPCSLLQSNSNCSNGQINYLSIQIHCAFVAITCNGQSYNGAIMTGLTSIINNPSCISYYAVNNPINMTFTTGPSGGYLTLSLSNLFFTLTTPTPTPTATATPSVTPTATATSTSTATPTVTATLTSTPRLALTPAITSTTASNQSPTPTPNYANGFSLGTTNDPNKAVGFRLQSYARYLQQEAVTVCNLLPVNFNESSVQCSNQQNNTVCNLLLNNLTPAPYYVGYTPTFTCQILLEGKNCTLNSQNATSSECSVLSLNCSSSLIYENCTIKQTPAVYPATNVYPGDQIYLAAQSSLVGYILSVNALTPYSSNSLYLNEPSVLSNLSLSNVFNVKLNSSTGFQQYQAIYNTTAINLVSAYTGNPLYLNNGTGSFLSGPNSPAPAVFRIVTVNNQPAEQDEGIPLDKRRLAKPKRERRSTLTCPSIFQLQVSGSTRNETAIDTCTAVQGCVLSRFSRIDQATISNSTTAITLGLGTYQLTTIEIGLNQYIGYKGIAFGACYTNSGLTSFVFINMTAGLRFSMSMSYNGYTNTRYFTSTTQDTSYGVLLEITTLFTCPYTTSTCNNGLDVCSSLGSLATGYESWFTIDREPSYPVFNYFDVCMPNAQTSGSLTANACSTLSTVATNINVPTAYGIYMYVAVGMQIGQGAVDVSFPVVNINGQETITPYIPPPASIVSNSITTGEGYGASSQNGCACIGLFHLFTTLSPASSNYVSLFAGYGINTASLQGFSFNANLSPFTCFANCLDVGTDRASCIELDYDRCVWAFNSTTESNSCQPYTEATSPIITTTTSYVNYTYNVTTQVAALNQPEPCTETGSTYYCTSGPNYYTVSLTYCGTGGSEGNPSDTAFDTFTGGPPVFTPTSSSCGGQISYFAIQISVPFVVITCNGQSYEGGIATGTGVIINNPSCSSSYTVNNPINITFTTGPSGGYVTATLTNLFSYTTSYTTQSSINWPATFNPSFTGSFTNCYYENTPGYGNIPLSNLGFTIANTTCSNSQIETISFTLTNVAAFVNYCYGNFVYVLIETLGPYYLVDNSACASSYTINNPLTITLTGYAFNYGDDVNSVPYTFTFNNLTNPSAPHQITTTTSSQPAAYLNPDANSCTSNCATAFTFTEYNCVNTNPTRVTSGYTITNTTCSNGQIQSVYIVLTGYGSYTDCNADYNDSTYTSNRAYLIQNTLCSSNYTVSNPLTVTFPSTIPFTLTFTNLIYNPAAPQIIQSCNVQELALGFSTSISSQPAAWICNQVSYPLGYHTSNYELVTFAQGVTSSGGFTGTFLPQPYINGEPPHCVWNPVDNACENYDIQYSSSSVDVIYCRDRLWQANNVGACITSPSNNIIYGGKSYTPRCAYVLPYGSAQGKCVTYAFDNSPTATINSGAAALGPYNLPYSPSLSLGTAETSTTILTQCLTPGTQCYFETTPTIPSTTAWYQGITTNTVGSNVTAFCNNYNSDSLGCPLKTYVNGSSPCTYYSNGLCAVNCNQFNNSGMACANNLPYNTCYYTKSTKVCQNNNLNFLALPSCSGYNCYSASTICYAYAKNQTNCEANSLCIWYNYANASSNYCDLKQNVQDPQCVVNGVTLSYCNTTYDQGLGAAIAAVATSCNINQTLSFNDYISTCVQLFDTTVDPPQNCVYSQFGSSLQFCTPANSATIASYQSQFGSFQPLTQITFDEYAQSQAPASTTYTLPFNQLPIRSSAGATIANFQNVGIYLIPDNPTGMFPCNESYTAVGQYCCLTSEVESNLLGQCEDTYYVNPYHPSYLLQQVYVDFCQTEVQAYEEVVVTNIEFPIYTAGITEPLPGQDGYTLDSRYCPTFSNGTDYPPGYVGNYSMYAYLLSDQAHDLQIGLLQGQSECTVDITVNNTDIQLLRIGAASWYAYANALTVSLYNGTLYNVTYFSNFTSHFLLSGNIDTTYRNMTTDFPTMFYNLIESDVNYWINDYNVRYGPRVDMWGCQIPGGISISQKYIQGLSVNTYAQLGNEAIFGAVSNQSYPVFRAKSYIDTMGATLTVTDPNNSTITPIVYSPTNYIVTYDNINLLPALNQAWAFGNTPDYVFSTPYSSSGPCQGIDFISITSDLSMGYNFNYTSAVARCPFFDPKWFQYNIGTNICLRNRQIPLNETDFLGIQFGESYTLSTNVQSALALSILYSFPVVDSDGVYLWQWWNNTLVTDGNDAVLAFVDALQAQWYALGCNVQLINYIPPQATVLIDNGTLLEAEDFFRPIYLAYKAALTTLGPNATASQGIAAISLEYLAPTVNSNTNAYCGNCGLNYGTVCIPSKTLAARSSTFSCQNGVSLASTAFDINLTPTIDTYTPHEGTANLLLTFQIEQITQLLNIETILCPNNTTPFTCSNSVGFVYCTFTATNPSNNSNIDVVFRISANGSISTCSLQQVNTIAPGQTYSSQFNLCPDTVSVLTIETETGYVCYRTVQTVGNYSSVSSVTNAVANSVYLSVYNGTSSDLINLLNSLAQTTDQVNSLQIQTFAISANITAFQDSLNSQYQQFLEAQNQTIIQSVLQNASLASIFEQYGNLTVNYILPLTTNFSFLSSAVNTQIALTQQLQANVLSIQNTVDNITTALITKQQYYETQYADELAGYNNQTSTANGIIQQFGNFLTYNEQYPYNYFYLFLWVSIPVLILLVGLLAVVIYLVWKVTTEDQERRIWDQDFQDYRLNIKRNEDLSIAVGATATPQELADIMHYTPMNHIEFEGERYPPEVNFSGPYEIYKSPEEFKNPIPKNNNIEQSDSQSPAFKGLTSETLVQRAQPQQSEIPKPPVDTTATKISTRSTEKKSRKRKDINEQDQNKEK